MTRLRTIAACDRSVSFSDLMHRFGKSVEIMPGKIARPNGGYWNSDARPFEGLAVESMVRRQQVETGPVNPGIDADWLETERLLGEAWQQFREHGDRHRYRADCRQIIARPFAASAALQEVLS